MDGSDFELTQKEFEILRELLTHQGRILTRQNLLDKLWRFDFYGDERVVDTHIKNLRKKLGIDFIQTIRGVGYKVDERYLTRSLEITNTLETMVQDILTISRLETAGADFKKDHLDCVQIIKAYLNETADLIAEKDLQIHLDILPSAFINGNKMLVEKVFSNLIGNAIKYSPQRADIWISVLMKHEQIVFSVENAGVHIPENSIPRLFDAFYRVEQSRSRKTGGSGLGLYIVQEILHQYGSECTVCNTQAGVKFSFII